MRRTSRSAITVVLAVIALCGASCVACTAPDANPARPEASPARPVADRPGTAAALEASTPPTAGETLEPGSDRDAAEAVEPDDRQEPLMSERARGPAAPAVTVRRLEVHSIEVAEGEDGHGQVVSAARPVALDVIADAWPGRALDPALHVGQALVFRHYRHPGPGVLRFVVADAGALPAGAPVYLQWGDDERSRVEVVDALAVPQ